jgi:hypothetical protein
MLKLSGEVSMASRLDPSPSALWNALGLIDATSNDWPSATAAQATSIQKGLHMP